ncbi:MAG: hypothetical protein WCO81_08555 [Cyanobacteriota bacterium ELA615]
MKINKLASALVASAVLLQSAAAHALTWKLTPDPIVLPPDSINVTGTFDFDGSTYSNINITATGLTPGQSAPAGVNSVTFTSLNGSVLSDSTFLSLKYSYPDSTTVPTLNAFNALVLNFGSALTGAGGGTADILGIGDPKVSNIKYNNDATATAFTKGFPKGSTVTSVVPFEFSPEQGFLLGVPLFLGLRQIKKRSAAKKQANI